ncbi:MAG TPA: hypothetical protein DCE41_13115 [Cytophagales bacterium]|nr:hypothetical protein [Cytophagales bacterium]HAA20223.1 hypothetical protein [Cytophagales bacterium]HAP64982.1 hypothetical protein [Cytophagales bacterium]
MQTKQPHDKFFKAFMKSRDVAEDLLQGTLPPVLQPLLKKGELTPFKSEFLSKEWKETYADVTYRIQLPQDILVDVVVLFEHKSYLPNSGKDSGNKPILLQLLEYIVGIWETDYRQKTGYQFLLPIVFYQGQKSWPYTHLREELFGKVDVTPEPDDVDEELSQALKELMHFQPGFDYILINLHDYDDDRILATFSEGMLRASLMAMSDYADGEPVRRIARYINNLQEVQLSDLSLSYIQDLAKYILALGPKSEERKIMEEIKETTFKIHPSDEPGFVSALDAINMRAEKAANEAKNEVKLAIAKRLKETNLSIEEIARISELSIDVVKGL